jgi:hypothetical protein
MNNRFNIKSLINRTVTAIALLTPLLLLAGEQKEAQPDKDSFSKAAAQANNPIANMKAFVVQDYYIGNLSMSGNREANQTWLRYAQPLELGDSKWLIRASLPVMSYPTDKDGGMQTGVGDFNIFAAYLMDTGNPAISFGFGPLLSMPTGSEEGLGTDKWAAGFSNILFNTESKLIQYGYLLTWQHSFAGDGDREDVNIGSFQYFAMLQLGNGLYLRSTPIMTYNFENDAYSVPIGLGIGKVFKTDEAVYNIYIEPQYTIFDEGGFQPEWQIFFGFNIQVF